MIRNLMNKNDIVPFLHDLNYFYRAKVSEIIQARYQSYPMQVIGIN